MSDGDDLLTAYERQGHWCEMPGGDGAPADNTAKVHDRRGHLPLSNLVHRAETTERELYDLGTTFSVCAERDVIGRVLPFDVIPRILAPDHQGRILKDGIVPAELAYGNAYCREQTRGNRGLTRIALSRGPVIVDSSRGGGSKDAWVAEP